MDSCGLGHCALSGDQAPFLSLQIVALRPAMVDCESHYSPCLPAFGESGQVSGVSAVVVEGLRTLAGATYDS